MDNSPDYDTDKVDDMALALLFLTLDDDGRAWKGMAWSVLDRLHEKGWIGDAKNKSKSVLLTPEGRERCEKLFEQYFGKSSE